MPSSPSPFLTALAVLLGGGLLSSLMSALLGRSLVRLAQARGVSSQATIGSALLASVAPLGWVVSATMAWQILPTSAAADRIAFSLAKLVLMVLLVRLANRICRGLLQRAAARSDDPALSGMIQAVIPLQRALVWCLGAVLYLQNIGVQMAAIWALLSAGGIGAGLALKEPVSEFFEYITILLDKPFQNGQLIQVGEVMATVERVGVRSTRLRSVNGEAIVMSNSALTSAVVSNYGDMKERRLLYRLGLTYDTSHEQLANLPPLLRSIVDRQPDARFDRAHFVAFSSSSLDFELAYFVPSNDFKRALDVQQRINLEIVQTFAAQGLQFAFPTQTIELRSPQAVA
ncbi:MAG: mechanosensitive ion channel family protein [Cyanobacteria bacterium M_surface_10_m1_298]|nr:mechanosensitive ion channel family protein [Cyanobacteria bacterium M_surface_10_m1_298]